MLDVKLTNDDIVGESFYNPWLGEIADDLLDRGVATINDGALCVFFDDVKGPDGQPTPLIVRKQDGGFGYAATDLAAIRHRVNTLGAKRIIYVVDTRQSLHFKMVFETARRAGYLPDDVTVVHVNFGTILGSDNKPLKSRAGDVLRLSELLKESVERANLTLTERSPELDSETREARAREIGIGAVKYADLSTNRIKDYVLDFDRMLALQGNTSVYLQYANARINSVMSKADSLARHDAPADVTLTLVDEERSLLLLLDKFGTTIQQVADTLEPHHLTTYLFDLSQAFTAFYEACPVLKADTEQLLVLRLAICDLCRATLARGLDLLGIRAPDRL
jgi:arginyl-tRNA synthetase